MKIKLLKAYSMFPPGEVVDFAKPIADLLIQRKAAEPIEEKKPKTKRVFKVINAN